MHRNQQYFLVPIVIKLSKTLTPLSKLFLELKQAFNYQKVQYLSLLTANIKNFLFLTPIMLWTLQQNFAKLKTRYSKLMPFIKLANSILYLSF